MNACPKCGSEHLRKTGFKKTAAGPVQQWVCVPAGHGFTGQEKYHRAQSEEQVLATKLAQEGLSVRAIARTVERAPRAVTLWFEKKANKRSRPTPRTRPACAKST